MEKIEYRGVVRFLTKQGKSAQTIMEEMASVYGDSCPGKTMIYKWHSLFKQGRDSLEDDPRPGRPIEVTTPEIIQKVEKIILEDAKLKKKQLGEYCASILERLKEAIKENRRGKLTKGVLLLHDNAPVHKSCAALAALHKASIFWITHPTAMIWFPAIIIFPQN